MKVHIIGIGGVGMSNLALLAKEAGHQVTGSDEKYNYSTEILKSSGIIISYGHSEKNVLNTDVVVHSVAITNENIEILKAKKLSIPVFTRSQFLNKLLQTKDKISIAGSFGKTTTSKIISDIFINLGVEPSVYIGSKIDKNNISRWGSGDFAIIETCEYKKEILHISPNYLLITNLFINHEDEFGYDIENIVRLFKSYIGLNNDNLKKIWIPLDNLACKKLETGLKDLDVVYETYGTFEATWYTENKIEDNLTKIYLYKNKEFVAKFETKWIGEHIGRNISPLLGYLIEIGYKADTIQKALTKSEPIKRRFQQLFSYKNIEIIDDNARLPEQVENTVKALIKKYDKSKKIVILGIWGKLNSRNLTGYVEALNGIDEVLILPSFNYEYNQNGPEPLNSDKHLASLLDKKGIKSNIYIDTLQLKQYIDNKNHHVILTVGYDNFISDFNKIYKFLGENHVKCN